MLQVKTYLDKSPVDGIGLYAKTDIPKDTIIWKFTPSVDIAYEPSQLEKMSELDRLFLEKYCFKYQGKLYLCVDDARFMNHSDTPNCVDIGVDSVASTDMGYTMTARHILAGEELTCDYRGFGTTGDDLSFNAHGVIK